jgi:hypothetical protein
MGRMFFDVAGTNFVQYDYRGRDCPTHREAQHLAEMLALDFGCTDRADLVGGEIQVRDISGRLLFSVPLVESVLCAA